MKSNNKKLTYISLFSSAGVGCYGFKENQFECVSTCEFLEKRIIIQKNNKKCKNESGYIQGDLSNIEIQNKIYKEIEKQNNNQITAIIASPPCQGMSVANHKKTQDEIKRNSLVVESIKIIKKVTPKFFIFENVRSFLTTTCTDIDNKEKPIKEAIEKNLGGEYNILYKIINFKDYGSQSSRTRTLVLGVSKTMQNINPYFIFPSKERTKTIKELIGNLPKLSRMGEINKTDIYHSFRKYDKKMLKWIETIKEGESAFDNKEPERIPHRIINNKIVFNKNKNGDKYKRLYWKQIAPCVHTRNDILASQNTIHPEDNRVFSIRELMLMMTIPKKFKWSELTTEELNKLTLEEKEKYLKKEELNIRRCIGEAIPTRIINKIAKNIKEVMEEEKLSINKILKIIEEKNLKEFENLKDFIKNNKKYNEETIYKIVELANKKRVETNAYFTRNDIVFNMINKLPDLKNKKKIRILEPSVGIGNFLPLLFKKYEKQEIIILDIVDIDKNALEILKLLIKNKCPKNFKINYINEDFLLWENNTKYDIVIGNPPFGKIINQKEKLKEYKKHVKNKKTNNIFAFFIEKVLKKGTIISLILPKSLINTPEFNETRKILEKTNLKSITDYGEKAFQGVKIETISFLLEKNNKIEEEIKIESYITKKIEIKKKKYIFNFINNFWLIYRNNFFDKIVKKIQLDIFEVFRDRQITKSKLLKEGKYRVLKARNIENNNIKDIEEYDCYINDIKKLAVSKYINNSNIVLVPNLTYNPRATFLPQNTIADGSVALLIPKNSNIKITKQDLEYYATEEFRQFYKIAKNYGTRSLNIDKNAVIFFGKKLY